MKEQLIEFETAKLAKEKGFNWMTKDGYRIDLDGEGELWEGWDLWLSDHYHFRLEKLQNVAAPTQSLLLKWLREVHKIYIEISVQEAEVVATWYWKIFTHRDVGKGLIWIKADSNGIKTSTYEEALEKGLQKALKLI